MQYYAAGIWNLVATQLLLGTQQLLISFEVIEELTDIQHTVRDCIFSAAIKFFLDNLIR